ncbi:MAG: O-antigen ligase family protein [Anaerolineales bacterium]
MLVALLLARGSWLLALGVLFAAPAGMLLNHYPWLSVIVWFVLMPFLPFETVGSRVFWLVHRALIPLAMGLAILARALEVKAYKPVKVGWAELSMVMYLVVAGVSVLLTRSSPLIYLYELYDRMFVSFAAYWLVRVLRPGAEDMRRLVLPMFLVCVGEIVLGFWGRYAPQTLPPIWDIARMGTRMSGTFTNPTPYAYTLIVCMVFIFHEAMHRQSDIVRWLLILTFCLGLFCIFLTFTRGCWLASAPVLLGLLILYPKTMSLLLITTIVAAGILSGTILADEVAFALKRLGVQDTVDSRIVLANAGREMFYAKPLWGWGFGNYDRYDWKFMVRVGSAAPTDWDINKGTSHNTYLTILAEMGLVGFFLQFFAVLWWLRLTIKVLPRLPREGFWSWRLLVLLWLSIIFYLIATQVMDARFFWHAIGTWWFSLGLVANMVQAYLRPEDFGLPHWARRWAMHFAPDTMTGGFSR